MDASPHAAGAPPAPLPTLIDQPALRRELGVSEAAAERIFAEVPVVRIPGFRKAWVRRADVLALIESGTRAPDPRRRAA